MQKFATCLSFITRTFAFWEKENIAQEIEATRMRMTSVKTNQTRMTPLRKTENLSSTAWEIVFLPYCVLLCDNLLFTATCWIFYESFVNFYFVIEIFQENAQSTRARSILGFSFKLCSLQMFSSNALHFSIIPNDPRE